MKKIQGDVYECPAFVDAHSHDDLALLDDPARADKRNQGIGSQVIGNCGISPFPALPDRCAPVGRLFASVMGTHRRRFASLETYRRCIRHLGHPRPVLRTGTPGIPFGQKNIVILQGYNALRAKLFGPSPRRLDAGERKRAAAAVGKSIDQGAAGISLGLAYLPALGADREELVDIARETPLLTVHLRSESAGVLESIDEAVDVARRSGCRLHVSHLKISGRPFWNKAESLIQKIKDAHESVGATFDHYPYAYGCTSLAAVLPPEISALPAAELARVKPRTFAGRYRDCDWENYVRMCGWKGLKLAALEKYPEYNGCFIDRIGPNPLAEVVRLVREEPHPAMLIYSQDDRLIDELLRLPFGCVGTDGLPPVRAHPRLTSTFPEYLKRCRAAGLSVRDAVEKASMLPRRIFGLPRHVGGSIRFNWSTGRIVAPAVISEIK